MHTLPVVDLPGSAAQNDLVTTPAPTPTPPPFPIDGPILGVDPGKKRVGIAVATFMGTVHPIGKLAAEPRAMLLKQIHALAQDRQCIGIVVGLPLNMDGSEGPQAKLARQLGDDIAKATHIPIDFCDERLTSWDAEKSLSELGYTKKKMKARVDAVAACGILSSYLEERKMKNRTPAALPIIPKDTDLKH